MNGNHNSGQVISRKGVPQGGGRPGWTGLLAAAAVVLVVGGFAFSRGYGPRSVPPTTGLPVSVSVSTSSTTTSSVTAVDPPDPIDFDWMNDVVDLTVAVDGTVFAVAHAGVASLHIAGDWTLINMEDLPEGIPGDGSPGRYTTQAAAGPDGALWVAGEAMSHVDDEQFGGIINGWTGGRTLEWIARYHCPICGEWTVFTTNEMPELVGGIGDLVVSSDGMVYASVGEDSLMVFDGYGWESYAVPLPTGSSGVAFPWSNSLAVGTDGVVWATTNYSGWGVVAFDGAGFTRYTTKDGLPGGYVSRVVVAADGTIWAATDHSGIASFDGNIWTTYTIADGLLSNEAVVATGTDGTVWAVHSTLPFGYSRFDGIHWTPYPFDQRVGGFRPAVASDGTLWAVSPGGLVSFNGITRTVYPSPFGQLVPGTITISIDGWEGVEGYRLLAGVGCDSGQGGGAFWTIIDSGAYSGEDVVHPMFSGEDQPDVEYESWGEGDYLWDETAQFEPGTCEITFWANPGELAPYGSHVPAGAIERTCTVDVEVFAGEVSTVVITDIPVGSGPCLVANR